jgi:hypothetical protein
MSTNLKDINFEFSLTPLSPHLPKTQISSSAVYIQAYIAYVSSWMWEINIRNHIDNRHIYSSVYVALYIFGQKPGRRKILDRI